MFIWYQIRRTNRMWKLTKTNEKRFCIIKQRKEKICMNKYWLLSTRSTDREDEKFYYWLIITINHLTSFGIITIFFTIIINYNTSLISITSLISKFLYPDIPYKSAPIVQNRLWDDTELIKNLNVCSY